MFTWILFVLWLSRATKHDCNGSKQSRGIFWPIREYIMTFGLVSGGVSFVTAYECSQQDVSRHDSRTSTLVFIPFNLGSYVIGLSDYSVRNTSELRCTQNRADCFLVKGSISCVRLPNPVICSQHVVRVLTILFFPTGFRSILRSELCHFAIVWFFEPCLLNSLLSRKVISTLFQVRCKHTSPIMLRF